jgi:MFS family permease
MRMRRTSTHLLEVWRTDLPGLVLLLQVGNAVNWFGYGLILPFEIIYLHQIRGFATATAGLVLAAILGTATLAAPPAGALLDHFRPKPILIASNLASALGYAGFAFVDRPWQAFACAVVAGAGVGASRTANQTLLITLVTPEQRPASFALGRVAQNLGLGIGATIAGFIVASTQHLRSFQTLYMFDAITYAAFALAVLAMVPSPRAAAAHAGAGGRGFRAVAVVPATLIHSGLDATALLAMAAIVFAIGECVHSVVLGPLVADLAPPELLGRYISLYSLMVSGGLALGPVIGGALLATSPDAIWWGGALVAAVIGAGFLLSGDRIPDSGDRIPDPLAATASHAARGDPAPDAA